jgi:hypothetical protein
MVMNSRKTLRTGTLTILCIAGLLTAACGSVEPSPTAPTPTPTPAATPSPAPEPAPEPTPAPTGPGRLDVRVDPNPVPWSGESVPDCNLANRWHYDQILRNGGGVPLVISDRVDLFDGAQVSSRTGLGIALAPGQETSIRTRWCSANNIEHRAQTNFSGSDDAGTRISFTGPTVRLLPG